MSQENCECGATSAVGISAVGAKRKDGCQRWKIRRFHKEQGEYIKQPQPLYFVLIHDTNKQYESLRTTRVTAHYVLKTHFLNNG